MGRRGADTLATARAALQAAERRVGVASRTEILDAPVLEERSAPLADLLRGRAFPKGVASVVAGSTNLLLQLLGATRQAGERVTFVGMPPSGCWPCTTPASTSTALPTSLT